LPQTSHLASDDPTEAVEGLAAQWASPPAALSANDPLGDNTANKGDASNPAQALAADAAQILAQVSLQARRAAPWPAAFAAATIAAALRVAAELKNPERQKLRVLIRRRAGR
jgi:hypothetical protein